MTPTLPANLTEEQRKDIQRAIILLQKVLHRDNMIASSDLSGGGGGPGSEGGQSGGGGGPGSEGSGP